MTHIPATFSLKRPKPEWRLSCLTTVSTRYSKHKHISHQSLPFLFFPPVSSHSFLPSTLPCLHPSSFLRSRSSSLLAVSPAQQLTDEFRITYCQLWHGLARRDPDAIKKHCLALNAGQLYPLLACIITARTWDSIQQGISCTPRSREEVGSP